MALKKSELYSSLWSGCDELRGGMDASQYKDYVLVLLFIKYVSDKYAGQPFAPITIPPGAGFKDMLGLKGTSDIGDQINKKIIAPLANANKLSDFPDFNDASKLGSGKEMVDRLTNLIAIFENKALDFSKNRADGDDILGDAYEYLMRHFATESGKSKGQFYTPAEVSRIIAQIIGIRNAQTSAATTVYDPTCGSGSLLLKVGDEAGSAVTLYGQEKDAATSGLARMNMILHNNPTALIVQGNTLADPKFNESRDGQAEQADYAGLKTFDYVVANPPFSDKRWSTGLDPLHDPFARFQSFGTPPAKQGDYAYLLHIVRSLKSTGKGACILPHGVLFRGNAEADIRRNLVRKGYIKGIIGLPANLFYGTGIPACIVVIDKEDAQARTGIFMIDASGGFMKDGPKNRLRNMDIHKIVDVFNKRLDVPKYARMVPFAEIEHNEFNLNLPRYIDSQTQEDVQDIAGHLQGGIPVSDVDALEQYWSICPGLKSTLFHPLRPNYSQLSAHHSQLKQTIYQHPEFAAFIAGMNAHFAMWRQTSVATLKELHGWQPSQGHHRSAFRGPARPLRRQAAHRPLRRLSAPDGLLGDDNAGRLLPDRRRRLEGRDQPHHRERQEGQGEGQGLDLRPHPQSPHRRPLFRHGASDHRSAHGRIGKRHCSPDRDGGRTRRRGRGIRRTRQGEQGFSHTPTEGVESGKWRIDSGRKEGVEGVAEAQHRRGRPQEAPQGGRGRARHEGLRPVSEAHESEIKTLVVDDKWLAALDAAIHGEMDRVSQQLTQRVKELAERYETPMPQMVGRVAELEAKVNCHLEKMGFSPSGKQTEVGVSGGVESE